MAKIRINALSKKLNKENKEIIAFLESIGVKGKTHSSGLDDATAKKVTAAFKKPPPAKAKKAPPAKKKAAKKPARAKAVAAKKKPRPAKAPAPPKPQPKEKVKVAEEEKKEQPRKTIKEIVAEKVAERAEVSKVAPGMKKAFQAIRKLDQKRPPGMFRRPHKERVQPKSGVAPVTTAPRKKSLRIQEGATVKEFSELIGVKIPEAIKKFMELGYAPTINQAVDIDAAVLVADIFGTKLEVAPVEDASVIEEAPEDVSKLRERPPIVTIMGHVDHGKTSLLDAIRETKVMDTEAGGITQHIGAYKVTLNNKNIVFLDTPGHEAFTSLRARGAKVTDIVILVVAADDGVKPQTIEAIDHAKAAGVPIIVAINKIDKPEANVQKVKTELAELDISPEDWGGKNIFVEISAKQHTGIESLLEMVLLQAEIMELKANPDRIANGVIIEARLDRTRGPIATVIVKTGTLNIGDVFISGVNFGKVRAMLDDRSKRTKEAGPSTPVELIGFGNVPTAGDTFAVIEDERKARQAAVARLQKQKSAIVGRKQRLTLDELYSKIKEGGIKDLNIIIKGDVHGSVEAIRDALEGIVHPEVQVKVIHSAVGGINESDVMLATASEAIIIGFNVRPEVKASQIAEKEGVDIELYNVIYEAIDDVKKALEGMLEPTEREKVLGRAEVRQTFMASRIGTIAGCYVTDGFISRSSDGIRVIRDNIVVYEGRIGSLKRFKEDAKEVQTGYECGITVENFNDVKVGDFLENFVIEKIAAKL
jgi:translation initiation factor IF-2